MSRLRTISDAIVTRLEEIPELAGRVILYRRSSIESEFERRSQKGSGKAVIVRLINGDNESEDKRTARYSGTISVTLFTIPTLTQGDAKEADELVNDIIGKLHGWWPDTVPSNGIIWLQCGALTFPDDAEYDVSNLIVKIP